ncbi:MAG: D-cysteine desulfhydrase family protein [Bacteroidota bacterium]
MLAHLPTPLEALDRLTKHLGGPRILIKRDDQTGLALGGNKARKLEFLVGDALSQGADTLLTAGAVQSNHCRQTAAAAARAGLRCELVLGGEKPKSPEGNLLLDDLFGAVIHWTGPERRGEALESIASSLRREGRAPYVIPYGGSNPIGGAAYAMAMVELHEQLQKNSQRVDAIVVASSSGGTQAGLLAGQALNGFEGQIVGIGIDKGEHGEGSLASEIGALSERILALAGTPPVHPMREAEVDEGYLGGGYGVVGERERDAIRLLARMEGILLDPVYTGRAMGGLIELIMKRRFGRTDTVLFWHTGGAPALFAYGDALFDV